MTARYIRVFESDSKGLPIPEPTRRRTVEHIEREAARLYAGKYTRLDIRFRGALCHVDAYVEPEPPSEELLKTTGETPEQFLQRVRAIPVHLFRLRHFAEDRWNVAFFSYGSERYEPCVFSSGEWFGTPEEALKLAGINLC